MSDLVGVPEVRWDKVKAGNYNFFMEQEMKFINRKQKVFVHHRILSAVTTAKFVSDRM
jgi:hypothetical protein